MIDSRISNDLQHLDAQIPRVQADIGACGEELVDSRHGPHNALSQEFGDTAAQLTQNIADESEHRMDKIRDKIEVVQALQTAELAHCGAAALELEESASGEFEGLQALHAQSAMLDSEMQEALNILQQDIITRSCSNEVINGVDTRASQQSVFTDRVAEKDEANDGLPHAPASQVRPGRAARGCRGTEVLETGDFTSASACIGSPDRRRAALQPLPSATSPAPCTVEEQAFIGNDPSEQQDKRLTPPLNQNVPGGEHHRLGLSDNCSPEKKVSQSRSPEKKKHLLDLSLSDNCSPDKKVFSQSRSPEKKKHLVDLSPFCEPLSHSCSPDKKVSQSCSPEKKKKKYLLEQSSLGEPLVLSKADPPHSSSPDKRVSQSCSPEKKKQFLERSSFVEPFVLSKGDLPHSSSPDKNKKRNALGGTHLDPLDRAPTPATLLCDNSCGSISPTKDNAFLAGRNREPLVPTLTGHIWQDTVGRQTQMATTSVLPDFNLTGHNWQAKEHGMLGERKGSLPRL